MSTSPSCSPAEVFLMLKVEQGGKKSFPFNMRCNVVKGCKSLFLEPWWNVSTLCLLLLPGSQKHFLESKTPDWSFNYLSITPSPSPDEVFLVLKVEQVVKKSFPFNMRCNVSTLHSMLKRVANHYSKKPLKPWWNLSTLCLLVLPGCQKQYLESKCWNPLCASNLASRSVNSCIYLTILRAYVLVFCSLTETNLIIFSFYRSAGRPLYLFLFSPTPQCHTSCFIC